MRGRVLTLALGVAVVLGGSAFGSKAHAFNKAARYLFAADAGGGGGRHFTGSLGDGYTCAVCHRGGQAPQIRVRGLPENGYEPNAQFVIDVKVVTTAEVATVSMEFVDGQGKGVGELELLPESDREEDERCSADSEQGNVHAAKTVDLENSRRVLAMDACGATRARARWTAPADPVPRLWFNAAAVAGDNSEDPENDGVATYAKVFSLPGYAADSARVAGGCHVTGGAPDTMLWLWVFGPVALLVGRRRRR